jgi:hypothetical protein
MLTASVDQDIRTILQAMLSGFTALPGFLIRWGGEVNHTASSIRSEIKRFPAILIIISPFFIGFISNVYPFRQLATLPLQWSTASLIDIRGTREAAIA